MRWEHLTVPQFEQAVQDCQGVGILAVGVLEPHASHLPLGTDMLTAHWIACRAAEREPAIVFPAYLYGVNHEGAHLPGSVVIRRELVLSLLENVCDEMARHGLCKVVLLEDQVEAMVRLLRAVKEDETTPQLMRELAAAARQPRSPWEHTRR